ncbi:c-type cytochrome [Citreimonas sp.]|uniref:c-type cytochrome n=1 Tax=Citreimonas sp. TaxID=3036715 RepID=UPI0035C7BEFC
MNIHWKTVGGTLLVLAVVFFVAASAWIGFGLYNVSARMGHFPGMSWVFHTTYRNAVSLWSDEGRAVPDTLDDPSMIALGAKHFESACRTCHGAPGAVRSATSRSMLPQPPHIDEAVDHWSPVELHWIVHKGIKMSGMPGWPAARQDDVWPIVAFLLSVRTDMTPERYESLTAAQLRGPKGLSLCTACHGAQGVPDNPHIPRLDILSETYITQALTAYRGGSRQSGIMQHAASEVPEEVLSQAATVFGNAAPPAGDGAEGAGLSDLARRGRELAFSARMPGEDASPAPAEGVAACRVCHGPWDEELDPDYPSIAGQNAPYLEAQLRLWRAEMRGGGPMAGMMHYASQNLTDADIEALAAYYAALPPARLNEVRDPYR